MGRSGPTGPELALRPRSIIAATNSISSAKRISSRRPSTALPIDEPTKAPANPAAAKIQRRIPLDVPLACVRHEIGERIDCDRNGTGSDRQMRVWHPHDIEQQRHCENRAAAADQTERSSAE